MSKRRGTPTIKPTPLLPAEADDAALFRAAVAGVKPLAKGRALPPKVKKPAPVPRSRIADERAVLRESLATPPEDADVESGEVSAYAAPGVQHATLRKLKRGQFRCEAEIDLHGLTRDRAHANLIEFLTKAHAHGMRSVRIVHGKGLGSGNKGPVIKRSLGKWLRRSEVLAWASAPGNQGGSGATLVLLKAQK
jgi:DNA-nicking Smr family endonuclease